MSTCSQRIELIVRGERRRRWSLEQKQSIVAESLAANVSIAAIARKRRTAAPVVRAGAAGVRSGDHGRAVDLLA